jgi:carbamoyltransferase
MGCEIDRLVVGNCVLRKAEQDSSLKVDYRGSFEAD